MFEIVNIEAIIVLSATAVLFKIEIEVCVYRENYSKREVVFNKFFIENMASGDFKRKFFQRFKEWVLHKKAICTYCITDEKRNIVKIILKFCMNYHC